MAVQEISRRDFFRRATAPEEDGRARPPWVSRQDLSRCTACGDCVSACPEDILKIDGKGRPFVDFSDAGCTFCGACAKACEAGVFGPAIGPGWRAAARVSDACLMKIGVACRVCTDFCDEEALRFDMSVRPSGALLIDAAACTGCGQCVGACPADAIAIDYDPETEGVAA